MRHFRPDKKCLLFIQILIMTFGALLTAAIAYFSGSLRTTAIDGGKILAICAAAAFLCLPFYYRSIVYTVSGDTLTAEKGIFFRTKQAIRFSSVQYKTTMKIPFLGNSVIFFVFGGKMTLVLLSGSDMDQLLALAEGRASDVS